jgi:hypothetical protein
VGATLAREIVEEVGKPLGSSRFGDVAQPHPGDGAMPAAWGHDGFARARIASMPDRMRTRSPSDCAAAFRPAGVTR